MKKVLLPMSVVFVVGIWRIVMRLSIMWGLLLMHLTLSLTHLYDYLKEKKSLGRGGQTEINEQLEHKEAFCCSNCGCKLDPFDLFCNRCGAHVADENLQEEPVCEEIKKVLLFVLFFGFVILCYIKFP